MQFIFSFRIYSEIRAMVYRIIILVFIIAGFTSCNQSKSTEKSSFLRNSEIEFAKTLKIFKKENYTLIHILHPENKSVKKYILSDNSKIKIPQDYTLIHTPVKSMITLSGTHIGMLEKLGGLNTIVGVSDKKYINNTEILSNIKKGIIHDFIGEHLLNFEEIITAKATLLMYSGFDSNFPHAEQLEKSGTICLANYDWKENHPLGRAEWIKLFGCLTGKEQEADSYFKQIVKEYNDLKSKAESFEVNATVFSGNLIGDYWYAPAGESYYAKLFKDANSSYVYSNTSGIGSIELSMEKVLTECRNTAFWFNPGYPSLEQVKKSNSKSVYFKAFNDKNVYCYSPNMNLYWEKSAVEPHHVLYDLICILHPEFKKSRALYFYKKLE